MKLNIKNTKSTWLSVTFCFVILFLVSCNSEHIVDGNGNDMQTESGLKLNISRSAFIDATIPESRVTNEGLNTTFNEGDVIGVLVTHNGENLNLPYKYENGTWTFDNSKGKDFYIKTQAGELNYVIYYPYSSAVDGKATKAELLEALPIMEDQSIEENYITSDVLYAEVSEEGTVITAQLKHARALFSYAGKAKLQTTLMENVEYNFRGLNIRFYDNNDKELKMYKTSDGEYRYIVPAGSQNNNISWVYSYEGKLYGDTKDLSKTEGNNKYSIIEFVKNFGVYDDSKAQIGDFYCSSSDNKGYLLPKEYEMISSGRNCVGIVFYIGAGNGDIQNDYSGTEIAANGIKGYVVALNDAGNNISWATNNDYALNAITDSDETKWNGFSNTNIIRNKGIDNYPACKSCIDFVTGTGDGDSGWYLPSIAQLGTIRDNINIIKNSFDMLQGASCIDDTTSSYYWSSTQKNGVNNQAVILYGPWYSSWDKIYGAKVRPILTF